MIISDIMMPVMDGFTLCYEWKKDDALSEIPFVFYTATYTDDRDEDMAMQLGADKFIRKPVEPDEFIATIQKVIEEAEQNKTASRKPLIEAEEDIFKLYNERLILKLEKKMLELEKEIAERKLAEVKLRESEEKYRTLYSSTNEGLALHEVVYGDSGKPLDYRILDVNPAYESITGIKKIDAVGELASQLYGYGDAPYLDIYAKVASSGASTTFETKFEPMDRFFKISVFQTGTGRFATLFEDITERKNVEMALQNARYELEKRVLKRTEELELVNKSLRDEVAER
jgi:PAS domain-containing protein